MTFSSPDAPPHPKTVAGRYELERLLREEPWGGVWLARDLALGAEVAVKMLSREEPGGAAAEESFLQEARLALKLRHPQVLGVLHFHREGDLLYLVEEAFAGESLQAQLIRHQPFSLTHVLNLLEQAAQALAFAHQRGVVHHSFNPLQVLVLGEEVRVANFTFAPPEDEEARHLELKAYVPPEVLQGESLTAAGNVFSLGVLGFRLAAGSLPYPLTFDEPFPYRLETPPVDLEEVPIPLQNLLLQCLAVEPEERFPDAGAFLVQLRHLREQWRGVAREAEGAPAAWAGPARAGELWARLTEGLGPRVRELRERLARHLQNLRPQTPRFWWGLGLAAFAALVLLVAYKLPRQAAPPPSVGAPVVVSPGAPIPVGGGPPLSEGVEPAPPQEAAAPAARPPAAALPAPGEVKAPAREERYLVIVGTYSSPEPARALAKRLRDKNIKAQVVKKGEGAKTRYLVQVGPVAGSKPAEDLARRLKTQEKLSPKVQKLPPPAQSLSPKATP